MKISFHQETTIDYPGKFGQILFTKGCNFRCGFCHNPDCLNQECNEIILKNLIKEIAIRAKTNWYTGICISGGEPTLHKDLPDFIKELKELGLSIKIDTNGSNPEALEKLKGLVDYIAMDIKCPKEKYKEITRSDIETKKIEQSILLAQSFPKCEFRTTILPFFTEKDIEDMGKWVSQIKKPQLWTLQQFNPEKVLDKEYSQMKPLPQQTLEKFSKILEKYVENVRVLS